MDEAIRKARETGERIVGEPSSLSRIRRGRRRKHGMQESESEFKRRLMPLADKQATLNDLHTTKEVLNILEEAKKEFHAIQSCRDLSGGKDRVNYYENWFLRWFGEAK